MVWSCDGIEDAWAAVVASGNPADYILVAVADGGKSKTQLEIRGQGEGGRAALLAAFEASQDQILFGVLKVFAVDQKSGLESRREKCMLIKFIGESVSGMQKARANEPFSALSNMLSNGVFFNVNVSGDELAHDFSVQELGRKLLQAGGAHKPIKYEFGAGEEIAIDALYADINSSN